MPARSCLKALYVIYDADGTVVGEIMYALKKLLGISHCAACDITHGLRREKPEFTVLKQSYGWNVPLHNIHRDEMDGSMTETVAMTLPCVVARTSDRDVVLLGPGTLDECRGSVDSLRKSVDGALERFGIRVPEARIGSRPAGESRMSEREDERYVQSLAGRRMLTRNRQRMESANLEAESMLDAVVPS